MKAHQDHWPRPWRLETETGCFGSIMAANGEPVAQVQMLAPVFEPDVVKRNEWRNEIGRCIAAEHNTTNDLLAALKDCLAIVRVQNGNLHDDINEIQKRAEAAIAKAEVQP